MAKKRLGDMLLELKAKTPGAMPMLAPASRSSRRSRPRRRRAAAWARSCSRCGPSPRRTCCRRSGSSWGSPYLPELKADDVDADLATSIPIGFAKQHRLLVVKREGDTVMVATADPLEVGALDDLRMQLQLEVQPVLVPSAADPRGHQRHLRPQGRQGRRPRRRKRTRTTRASSEELVDILEVTDEAPIIRWVNSLLFNAVKERASDIHIEPGEKEVIVRYRIDGELYEIAARGAPVHAVDHLAREDHGRAEHRREAPAPGRPHPPQDRRQGHRHARRHRPDGQGGRAHHHPSARSRIGAARSGRHRLRRRPPAPDGRPDPPAARHHAGHRARPARARRRRCTPASPRSTRPTSTSSPSRIRSSTSSTASRRWRSTRRSS